MISAHKSLSLIALLLAWRTQGNGAFVVPATSPTTTTSRSVIASPLTGLRPLTVLIPSSSRGNHGLLKTTTTLTQAGSSTALGSILGNILEAVQNIPDDFDLAFGMFVIFCAVAPYFVGLFFPKFLFKEFFIPVYGADKEDDGPGRRAEIYWKLLYATQGLVLTSIIFTESILGRGIDEALRDSYVAWALFYIVAIIKIRYEATKLNIIEMNRFGIQAWHSFVVIALLVNVGLRPDVVQSISKVLQ